MIVLERWCQSDTMGTFGSLTVGRERFVTCELPWRYNRPNQSCIPAGNYRLAMRNSPMVERVSHGHYKSGWEVTGVAGRTFIMFHPGNTVEDTDGCILVGTGLGYLHGLWSIRQSQEAFGRLMAALDGESEWELDLRWMQAPEYP